MSSDVSLRPGGTHPLELMNPSLVSTFAFSRSGSRAASAELRMHASGAGVLPTPPRAGSRRPARWLVLCGPALCGLVLLAAPGVAQSAGREGPAPNQLRSFRAALPAGDDSMASRLDARRPASRRARVGRTVPRSSFVRESGAPLRRAAQAPQGPQGPVNPRLLPDISAVADLMGDFSPDGSTQEDGSRFGVRELELALQAAVDPYFRGDVFIGFSDAEGVAVEQAYMTATSLPLGIEVRGGRFLMPVTKQNLTHRHDLHTIEHSLVVQRFLGEEGLKGTGLWVSRVFSPFGFYQEALVTAVDRFGEAPEDLATEEPVNKKLSGLTYTARLRNYWDLSESSNLEVSGSAITAMLEQPVSGAANGVTAVAARQNVLGVDLTYRWRPLQQGLYRSFLLQGEWLRQTNRSPGALPEAVPGQAVVFEGPGRGFSGGYAFARYQISRRGYLGARVDALQDPEFGGGHTRALSGFFQFYPSEFSKIVAGYQRLTPPGGASGVNRILLQATFALGPHKPHPF